MQTYFATQKGLCHVLEDRLVFNQSSNPEELFDIDDTYSVVSPLWMASALPGLFLYFLATQMASFQNSEVVHIVFVVCAVLYCVAWVYAHYDIVHQQTIMRKDFVKIKTSPAFMQKAYRHLVVYYRNEKGRLRRHYIMLRPESLGGKEDLEIAQSIFTAQGYLPHNF
ncbi:hypothetical protein [Gilvibacter sediminis]|uniref:hypothetical protein n=1 Tax=Gilvibacter sediminis TaxID=379071 RepID=UPI0023503902|nr:hypothetical protein [Gilvibacter sediminis]MDC7997538.1 hypothetical protein [Gilvibacter sediminis]